LRWLSVPVANSAVPQTTTAGYWTRCTAARKRARVELTAHLQAGAAELQRLRDLLAQSKQLTPVKDSETSHG
jgi:hypothetical protein